MYHNLCKLKSQWQSVCCSCACSSSFVVQEDAEVGGVMMRGIGRGRGFDGGGSGSGGPGD